MKIKINRKTSFDPVKFIGEGWSIEEQDKDSLRLKEIDLSKIQLKTNLKSGEAYIMGEENLKRETGIKLDAKILQILWENQKLIPESWKERTNGDITWIYFDGTILRSPRGHRCTLCLCFRSGGSWRWGYSWLGGGRGAGRPSAGLASSGIKTSDSLTSDLSPLDLRISELEDFKAKVEKVLNLK